LPETTGNARQSIDVFFTPSRACVKAWRVNFEVVEGDERDRLKSAFVGSLSSNQAINLETSCWKDGSSVNRSQVLRQEYSMVV
jgi:hypothetical protein